MSFYRRVFAPAPRFRLVSTRTIAPTQRFWKYSSEATASAPAPAPPVTTPATPAPDAASTAPYKPSETSVPVENPAASAPIETSTSPEKPAEPAAPAEATAAAETTAAPAKPAQTPAAATATPASKVITAATSKKNVDWNSSSTSSSSQKLKADALAFQSKARIITKIKPAPAKQAAAKQAPVKPSSSKQTPAKSETASKAAAAATTAKAAAKESSPHEEVVPLILHSIPSKFEWKPKYPPSGKPITNHPDNIEWDKSYHGLGTQPVTSGQFAILTRTVDIADVQVKPDGILYLPEIKYRRRLNEAFGPMGWGIVPRGEPVIGKDVVTREYALIANGCFVSQALGVNNYFNPEGIPQAVEGAKSNALMRCCKDLGIASELWDPNFIRWFNANFIVSRWIEHTITKKKRVHYYKKGNAPEVPYPYKLV